MWGKTAQLFLSFTFLELWWISIWGILSLSVAYMAGNSKEIELLVYIVLAMLVVGIVTIYPDVLPKYLVE